jgi:hypothetical protein
MDRLRVEAHFERQSNALERDVPTIGRPFRSAHERAELS